MSNELTVIDRARSALKFDARKAELAELITQSERIVAITNPAGYTECHRAQMLLRDTRNNIIKDGKESREDATAFSKAIIAAEKELVDLIEPEETRLKVLKKSVDDAKELERLAAEQAKRDAQEAIRLRFEAIRALPLSAIGCNRQQIESLIEQAGKIDLRGFPDTVTESAATYEVANAVAALKAALKAREEQDARDAQAELDRRELAELRELQAENDRRAAAEKAHREAEAEKARKAAQAAQEAALQELARLAAVAQAEEDRLAAAQRKAEADKLAADRAELAREKAEQDRVAKTEADRQAAEAKKLADDRKALEKRQAEAVQAERDKKAADDLAKRQQEAAAALEREQREIESAGAQGAMRAAYDLLTAEGYGAHKATKMLAAVLGIKPKAAGRKVA